MRDWRLIPERSLIRKWRVARLESFVVTKHLMTCDLIVVNFGSADESLNAIRSVRHHLRPMLGRVIVVENGTGEGGRFQSAGCEVIDFGENRGFAAAVNAGFEKSLRARNPARQVMILNPDAYLIDGPWLRFVSWIVPPVAACGPCVYSPDGTIQASIYGEPDPVRALLEALGMQRLAKRCGVRRKMPFVRTEAASVQGSCIVFSTEAWKVVGPFDPMFFLYHEETDWCLRARDRGYEVMYDPSVGIVHAGGVEVPPGREATYYSGLARLVAKRRGALEGGAFRARLRAALHVGSFLTFDAMRRSGLRAAARAL
jgi:N-acetylglucosaminyl-diphospho-decaprenol L-rhamnosyltransferase